MHNGVQEVLRVGGFKGGQVKMKGEGQGCRECSQGEPGGEFLKGGGLKFSNECRKEFRKTGKMNPEKCLEEIV